MPEIEIRRLCENDIAAVVELEKEAFGKEAWSENDFLETLKLDYAYYVVACKKELIIGSSGLRNLCGEADITNVVVSPKMRKKGVAEFMLQELMKHAAENLGVQSFTLEVRSKNVPAIKLYEKLGFVTEGVRKNFYTEPADDALIMWKR
ncbi:MAG: ribosomal protein S18-alanine N-acetyltransferase [Lachnospiraceae bacterium]|nr:ribosomal protein S18-alanine N-acetyltransferase [Lachnospiraceae bacterium]